ncbi:DUF1573 domain-containing protein [Bacteroides sp.]|uniref:DUF1573 domain-containing protein n=1 Tax=Bacteroides sp. TaxID=29523 RepID=UPI0026026052|nr:DUF1573 domain-containing protein [Bacteroides sp.]MDD3038302.1 DUF1573 domain-containing protein [Bacteroides sp.]
MYIDFEIFSLWILAFLLIGCNKKPEIPISYLLGEDVEYDRPTLLFLSDTSSINYRRTKELLNTKESKKILQNFQLVEENIIDNQYFNHLFYSFAKNCFIIIDKGSIASVIVQSNSCDSINERISNYKNYPLKKCVKDISLLKGDDLVKSIIINQIFRTQNLFQKNMISVQKHKDNLLKCIKKFPYFYNRYLYLKINESTDLDYTWLDSLNRWERSLYDLYVKELQMKRCHIGSNEKSNLVFDNNIANLGKIEFNDSIERTFYLLNKSKVTSIIYNVETTCGCTAVSWPHYPILPGRKDSIKHYLQDSLINRFELIQIHK